MWGDYPLFLIATLVFTRLLLDETYHLIELSFEWLIDDAIFVCLLDEMILGFCYSDLTLETGGIELASAITPVLQANRLTKCASHPKSINGLFQWTSFYMIGTFVMKESRKLDKFLAGYPFLSRAILKVVLK